ncbi:hypothetical protein [Actinacidiphila bryophytorum]|uniref:hypothetical protein n=1 Tax=Actinacidiphila bryophytorum TaxID=1436133 RepID=UPI002176A2E8|nr:hypothetical protein [Actinacidiphila bryophytorum]UWE08673.1 hypothetical protein NYE86_08025 [Actinacidiphila bryophytorum]
MPTGIPLRRTLAALLLAVALLALPACGGSSSRGGTTAAVNITASPSASQQKLAKTRFVANAGLAAGAAYQWIIKPYRKGSFKKGAKGRTVSLIKAGLAGTFAYNRLKAASNNAKGDPTLSKYMAPVTAGIDALKDLPKKVRKGDGSAVNSYDDVINKVKEAGKNAGADVKDQVPSLDQLKSG